MLNETLPSERLPALSSAVLTSHEVALAVTFELESDSIYADCSASGQADVISIIVGVLQQVCVGRAAKRDLWKCGRVGKRGQGRRQGVDVLQQVCGGRAVKRDLWKCGFREG